MKTVNTGTTVPLEKCPFRAFPSRPALYAGRLLTNVGAFVGAHLCAKHFADSFVRKADSYSFADNQKRFNDRSKEFLFGQQPVKV